MNHPAASSSSSKIQSGNLNQTSANCPMMKSTQIIQSGHIFGKPLSLINPSPIQKRRTFHQIPLKKKKKKKEKVTSSLIYQNTKKDTKEKKT